MFARRGQFSGHGLARGKLCCSSVTPARKVRPGGTLFRLEVISPSTLIPDAPCFNGSKILPWKTRPRQILGAMPNRSAYGRRSSIYHRSPEATWTAITAPPRMVFPYYQQLIKPIFFHCPAFRRERAVLINCWQKHKQNHAGKAKARHKYITASMILHRQFGQMPPKIPCKMKRFLVIARWSRAADAAGAGSKPSYTLVPPSIYSVRQRLRQVRRR